jgi:hypothetical protein
VMARCRIAVSGPNKPGLAEIYAVHEWGHEAWTAARSAR